MSAHKGKKKEGVERLIKMSPVAETLSPSQLPLPEVNAPSLSGLKVLVPAPEDLTQDDLERRFHEKLRAGGTVRARTEDEALAAGDEVQLDVIGYADGKLLPFSPKFGWWTELAPMPALPGFMEGVATGHVGESLEVRVTLPDAYPVEALRGVPVRFVVDVLAAREVKPLDPDAPGFFVALKLGANLDEVFDTIRDELEEELSDELALLGRELVLDEVVARTEVTIPTALVDEEIKRRWAQSEGAGLIAHQATAQEQQEARDTWLVDPLTRADCERRLKVGLALRSVMQAQHLEPKPEELKALLTEYAAPWGLTETDLTTALKESKKTATTLGQLGLYLWLVDQVVSQAQVVFEGA